MQRSRIGFVFGFVIALITLTAAGASAQHVTTDHANIDFSRYTTFNWIKAPATIDPLMRQRIVDDVNAALTAKGLKLVESGGDLAIAAHSATRTQRTLQTFYDGFGGGWRWRGGGFGSSTTQVLSFQVGTLVIDIFDGNSKEAVWRGTATKTLSDKPQKNAASLNKAVASMFKDFPPQTRMGSD